MSQQAHARRLSVEVENVWFTHESCWRISSVCLERLIPDASPRTSKYGTLCKA